MKHARTTLASLALIIILPLSATADPADAAGNASIALNLTDYLIATGGPHYGDTVNFTVSQSRTNEPWVSVTCLQNGSPVYQQTHPYFEPFVSQSGYNFALSSDPQLDNYTWNGGGATCRAVLWMINNRGYEHDLASTSFVVN